MNLPHQVLRSLCLFLFVTATAAAQPNIVSLSSTTASRSSRLLIQGAGFGAVQGTGHVEIGGVPAPLTRWSDTLIAAYVPEAAPTGTASVQVFDSAGASSNTVPVGVTLRDVAGRIRWRFQADADYIQSRPAVAGDGTVYAIDVYGHLYALAPDGALRWIFNATLTGFGNVSVGPDGTIYTGSTSSIFALAPDGTLKWQFQQNPGAFILLGPNVGPDGNIYAVATQGMGVFSLTPQGSLRWSVPENYSRPIVELQEIVFAPPPASRLYFHANDHIKGFGLDGTLLFTYVDGLPQDDHQPAVSPDGSLYTNLFSAFGPGLMLGKFDGSGNLLWQTFDKYPTGTNALTAPDVGPDGVVYDGRNLSSLYSLNPDSSVRWQYIDSGILLAPIVSPLNDLIFVGGIVDYGQPGFFEAVSTSGVSLWKFVLPLENGLDIVPGSRARFTLDGQTAYIGTSIAGQTTNGYSYLYSVQTASSAPPATTYSFTLTPTTLVGGNTSRGDVTLSAPAPSGGAVIALTSANSAVATVPVSVTVKAGATAGSFTVNTSSVTTVTGVQIATSYAGAIVGAVLTVQPGPSGPSLSSLSLFPTTVRSAASSQGTVTLSGAAPAGGVQIRLSSSNPSVATVPASITVAAGATSATFTVQSSQVKSNTSVTISASLGSITKTASLSVKR
ncbi:MAG TPA: IPT/TIG domain-containing protein [Thermoanaerobaculia bacterium]|nr:IPT/TIG domain-containing protein [Thermoanaerobaculia bacterium]